MHVTYMIEEGIKMQTITEYIEDFQGKAGLVVTDISGKRLEEYNPNEVFGTASVIKIFLLAALLAECDAGKKNLNDILHVENRENVGGTGILKEMKTDFFLSVYDMAVLMIIISDNVATNLLVDYLGGVENVNTFLMKTGLTRTKMNRKVSAEPTITSKVPLGETTPAETADFLRKIYHNEILSDNGTKIFLDICGRQQMKNAFVREITSVRAAHKTGMFEKARNDAGFLFPENGKTIIFAAFTESEALEEGVDAKGYMLLGNIGKMVYEQYCKEEK